MKITFSSQHYSLFLLIGCMFIWPLSLSAISEVELNHLINNADQAYIYCDRAHSKMAEVMAEISNLDPDKNSPIWQLHDHIQKGFSIGREEAIIEALEWAALFLEKNYNKLNRNKFEQMRSDLDSVMNEIANAQLAVDVDSLVNDESLRADSFQVRKPTTFQELVKFKNKVSFKDFANFHSNVHFQKDVTVKRDLTVNGSLTVDSEFINCNVTVDCNILMKDSISPASGNITKNGIMFMHNYPGYAGHNTFLGDAAGNFVMSGNNNSGFGWQALNADTAGSDNTALGNQALESNTSGLQNTAVGSYALQANVEGVNNTAVGYNALSECIGYDNTAVGAHSLEYTEFGNANTGMGAHVLELNVTGNQSTAFGYRAMENHTEGFNAAFGYRALNSNTTGLENSAFGWNALSENTIGEGNTALGNAALMVNVTGNDNTAVGAYALYYNTEGFDNTATGHSALYSNTTGNYNVAFGFDALYNNTTGGDNTAAGTFALEANITGNDNTGLGYSALTNNISGYSNTAVGSEALYNGRGNNNAAIGAFTLLENISGNNNTAVGTSALENVISGSNNIALGYEAGVFFTSSESNNIDISNVGVVGESGVIRIGTYGTHTAAYLQGIYNTALVGMPVEVNITGQLGVAPSSDKFKRNVRNMNVNSADIHKLRPVTFEYNDDKSNTIQYGLIAEEVADIYPSLVVYDEKGNPYSVRYQMLPALLLNEIQKQQAAIQNLVDRVDRLEENAPAA